MKVKPKLAFRHTNYPLNTALDPNKIYEAIPAHNQPNYKEEGKIFVECPNGAPELLLVKDDYIIIDNDE